MSVLSELSFPLIQAPMAGADSAELVAAVSQAGCLGSIGAAYLDPDALRTRLQQVRALTTHPFAVNLFIPGPPVEVSQSAWDTMARHTRRYREVLGLADPARPAVFAEDFAAQVQVVLEARPRVFSFTFGIPDAALLAACRERGITTLGTATTVKEALLLKEAGVDCVCAQGVEAGGHRGTFASATDATLDVLPLVQEIRRQVRLPLIAAGGLMNGRGIAAALMRGADAVQLGTAFLACAEAGTSAAYRAALVQTTSPKPTVLTRAFSGRTARGIRNTLAAEMAEHAADFLPFPAQNAFTRDIRAKAAEVGNPEYLSLWAGQGVNQIRSLGARQLIDTLRSETAAAQRK